MLDFWSHTPRVSLPRGFNGETFKEQTDTTLGEHPGELVPQASSKLELELTPGELAEHKLDARSRASSLRENLQLAYRRALAVRAPCSPVGKLARRKPPARPRWAL